MTLMPPEAPSKEIVPYTNGVGSLIAQAPRPAPMAAVGSISEEASILESDPFSQEMALRRSDGSLFINIPAHLWNKSLGAVEMSDLEKNSGVVFDHVSVSADYVGETPVQGRGNANLNETPEKYTLISMQQIGVRVGTGDIKTRERVVLGPEHLIRLGANVKSTTLPSDRENEVYIGVDAIRSVTRRLQEAEVEIDRITKGITGSNKSIEEQRREIMNAYHCSDLLGMPVQNAEVSSISDDSVMRKNANKLPNMIRDLYRVN